MKKNHLFGRMRTHYKWCSRVDISDMVLGDGDACRTYLSDTTRVDIALTGNVKDSCVTVEGANTRISQPAWFSGHANNRTQIELSLQCSWLPDS